VAQARSQYETAAAAIPPIEVQIVRTENALAILLGRNPGPIARGQSIFTLALPDVPAGLPSQLLERRPDLVQAEQNLIAANAQIGAAKALYFPTISLTAALGVASSDLSNLFKGPARLWSYAGSITGPIFTAGAIAGQVQQAKAGETATLLSYEAAIQNAFADVENALIARAKTPEQLAAQERLVTSLREYAYFARLQYDAGYAPYLTVLNAQQQLFPAELNLAQIRAAVLVAYINLYQAMGGGWVIQAETLTGTAAAPSRPW
jgi:multidrug efflux system outer membrane protein